MDEAQARRDSSRRNPQDPHNFIFSCSTELLDCFVKTESTTGLTEALAARVVQLLRVDRGSEWWERLKEWKE